MYVIRPNKCYVHIPVHLSSVGTPTQPARSLKYTFFDLFKLATPTASRGLRVGLPHSITQVVRLTCYLWPTFEFKTNE